jgi:hypothetical protein
MDRLPILACSPKPCGRSPARPKGNRSRRTTRYPTITKAFLSASHDAYIWLLPRLTPAGDCSSESSLVSSWLKDKLHTPPTAPPPTK